MLRIVLTGLLASLYYVPLALATDVTVTVSATATHPVPTGLWGASLDEVNSIDGGLYAEMIKNRAFQKVTPGTPESLTAWHAVGGATMQVVKETTPLSVGVPNALQVTFPSGKILPLGIANEGFFGGMQISTTTTYSVSFWYRFPTSSSFRGNMNVGFRTADGLSLGSVTVAISGAQTGWTQVLANPKPVQTPLNNNNWFALTIDGPTAAGQVINFAMISLVPPMFLGRQNYVRSDIGNVLSSMNLGFLRYPGKDALGNGNDAERWRWNNTVDSYWKRPGHMTGSGYFTTDGFGLFEFLVLCEDIRAKPIMTVYAGLTKDGSVVSESDLLPIIQEAIDQINFAIGPPTTPQGSLRNALGHGPFNLQFVEIGADEENTSEEYQARWTDFVIILSQTFPQLRFIAASNLNTPPLVPNPTHWDFHIHETEGWFAQNSFHFDSFDRNGTQYLISEFEADEGLITYPTMQSAADEAAFMTGIERNSDIIFGAGHAPLLNNIPLTTTSPSFISFDQANVILSTSALVQRVSTSAPLALYNPSNLPDPNGSVFWSITSNLATGGQYIVKVVNIGGSTENVTIIFPHTYTQSNQVTITGTPTIANTPSTPSAITAQTVFFPNRPATTVFNFLASPCSVNFMRLA